MGDRDTQTQQEPSWWASDASPEDLASSPSFDQPVEWPDAMAWESLFEDGPEIPPVYVPDDFDVDLRVAPEAEREDEVGGGLPSKAPLDPLPASIWAPDPADDEDPTQAPMASLGGAATAVAGPPPAPMAMAEPHRGRRPGPQGMRRLQVRHGNAAVVALACCVSLVLLGMFLSVRARDDLPTQTTQFEPTGGQIATQSPTSSVPPPTTTATTTAPPSISLSDLIPADAAAGGADAGGTAATTARTAAPATTAAPTRNAAPSGGGAAQQPTNTTAAPDPEPTSPPPASPPTTEATTTPTTARVMPTIRDYTIPSFTVPTWPPATNPGSSFRTGN